MSKPEVLFQAGVVVEGLSYGQVAGARPVSLRYGNRMLHLGIGRAHARTEIIIVIHNTEVTIITLDVTVLGDYTIDPKQSYQAKRKNG